MSRLLQNHHTFPPGNAARFTLSRDRVLGSEFPSIRDPRVSQEASRPAPPVRLCWRGLYRWNTFEQQVEQYFNQPLVMADGQVNVMTDDGLRQVCPRQLGAGGE